MIKKLLVFTLVATAFALGYGVSGEALFGRNNNVGHFYGVADGYGTHVFPLKYDGGANALPNYIDNVDEFISFIMNNYWNGSSQEKIGAAFIIDTMYNGPHGYPISNQELIQWDQDVRYYANNGWIQWTWGLGYNFNSYYQGTGSGSNPNDDAFYANNGSALSIIFSRYGVIQYGIRRQCANPVGRNGEFSPIDRAEYNMTGYTTVNNATPFAGDTITFSHFLYNYGPTMSWPTQIAWIAETWPGTALIAGPANAGGFYAGETKLLYYSYRYIPPDTPGGTQICERVGWSPVNSYGGRDGRGAPVCATVRNNFNLTPSVSATVGGTSVSTAEPNDTLTFTYAVSNAGPGPSSSVGCSIYGVKKNGSYTAPTPADSTSDVGYVPPATGCPRIFPVGGTTITTENVSITAADINKTICRSLYVVPARGTAPDAAGAESCVRIAAKPYLRVYGGDVSAGSAFANSGSCSNNSNASIIGWNRGSAGGWSGSATQYANFALNTIYSHAAALGVTGVDAPSGLSFGNTSVNTANGLNGGAFGSLPCITDHFATKPASAATLSTTDISGLTTGAYSFTGGGSTTLHGTLGANRQVSIFVDGNVLIDGNIAYPASWNSANTPLLQLVVKGNIYVSRSVTRLDGVFIAQPNGTNGGIIYTCANTALPGVAVSPADGTYFSTCNSKLTINGSFVARQVQFLRTSGSLGQSTAGESAASGFGAEVFNYSPALWMARPAGQTSTNSYDSIVSLPPIL